MTAPREPKAVVVAAIRAIEAFEVEPGDVASARKLLSMYGPRMRGELTAADLDAVLDHFRGDR